MTQPVEPNRYSAIEMLRDGSSIEIRTQTRADVAELRTSTASVTRAVG
jgi:tRNA threonylcarbamoyladenosine modification (KEOPS) complex  Pcc1 subunit